MSNFLNIIFIILLYVTFSIQHYVVFKFKTNINLKNLNEENYMNSTLDQKIYVNIDVGDSHQIIPITIKTQQNPTFIVSSRVSNDLIKYDETKSLNSFHYINNILVKELYRYDFTEGYLVNDSIVINSSYTFKNFTYMLATETNVVAKNISGEIGLSIKLEEDYQYFYPRRTQFLNQLKENELIKNKIFGIVYDNEYEGRIIFGGYLHQIDDIYTENEMITNYIGEAQDKNRGKLLINFDFKLNNRTNNEIAYIEENTYGLIMYELGLIVGSQTFRENYAIDYFKQKGCKESMISSKPFGFYQYTCENESQFSDFPNLSFSLPGKFLFNFTKKELFKKIGNKYIFQIVFEVINLEINYWRIGQPLFRKYNIFFNWGDKQSTFSYYPVKKTNKKESGIDKEKWQIALIIILSAILVVLIAVVIYFIIYCEKKKRKRMANEMVDDDFVYKSANDDTDDQKNNHIINH